MTRNRLYLLLAFGVVAGYCWILWFSFRRIHNHTFTPCLFKNTTGIACPSCGSTRSVLVLSQGQLTDALLLNPLGIIIALIMLIVPFWLLYDIVLKKNTLYTNFKKTEAVLRNKWVAGILIILLLINWAWNIQKGL